jgi:acyl-CoA thioester hydrolase
MIECTTSLRVRYADTDQMRHAYYGMYFAYFEQGRSDLMRSIGLPYGEFEAMGYFLPVIEAHAVYKKPARYDEMLLIVTTLVDKPVARVRLDYRIYNEQRTEVVVEGYTVHSFVHASTGKPTRAPAHFLEVIEQALQASTRKERR